MTHLLEGEADIGGGIVMTGREWASSILSQVASRCEWGSYPQEISGFDLGRAIGRAIANCDDEHAELDIIRGMSHVSDQREERVAHAEKASIERQ